MQVSKEVFNNSNFFPLNQLYLLVVLKLPDRLDYMLHIVQYDLLILVTTTVSRLSLGHKIKQPEFQLC